ncbi:MAG: DUF512 domain-containing protein [Ruminococcaceae bacterium]|nr:DUF512 domain-containing protein [Oscillospiraceae bacterium]
MIEIKNVVPGSYADKKGIKAGEKLVAVNGHTIRDILDYRFYICEKTVTVSLDTRDVTIKKDEYDDIGLEFETYLMDKQESCRNKCIFCFIDQNPHGMRESIYFKDDDTRLAFLFGNYVTLTNVPDSELERLIKMHISPVNVSVQATNPELRQKMLGNRFAGRILEQMHILADGGIDLNAQIVLCKGVNDGDELERSLRDLEALVPSLKSVSVVPVGLTKYRRGLYPLEPFSKDDCIKVVETVERLGEAFLEKHGTRLVFASDEFYLKAGRPIPSTEFYEGYPQLENGVGMIASFTDDLDFELDFCKDDCIDGGTPRHVSIATGMAAYETIVKQVEKIKKIWYNIKCDVYAVRNDFYGENVTVSGLLTGGDIIAQLKGKTLGETLLIPRNALRHEGDRFLDDVTLEEMENALGVKVIPTDGAEDLLHGIID